MGRELSAGLRRGSRRSRGLGQTAGAVYAANTLGGIVGALFVSLTLLPGIGARMSERAMLITAVASGATAREANGAAHRRKSPGWR